MKGRILFWAGLALLIVNTVALLAISVSYVFADHARPSVKINGITVPCSLYSTGPGTGTWVCVRVED